MKSVVLEARCKQTDLAVNCLFHRDTTQLNFLTSRKTFHNAYDTVRQMSPNFCGDLITYDGRVRWGTVYTGILEMSDDVLNAPGEARPATTAL